MWGVAQGNLGGNVHWFHRLVTLITPRWKLRGKRAAAAASKVEGKRREWLFAAFFYCKPGWMLIPVRYCMFLTMKAWVQCLHKTYCMGDISFSFFLFPLHVSLFCQSKSNGGQHNVRPCLPSNHLYYFVLAAESLLTPCLFVSVNSSRVTLRQAPWQGETQKSTDPMSLMAPAAASNYYAYSHYCSVTVSSLLPPPSPLLFQHYYHSINHVRRGLQLPSISRTIEPST